MHKIEIAKRSEHNYTFHYVPPINNGGEKSIFYNIFVEDSEDYRIFAERVGINSCATKPEDIEGLKIVKKGKDDSETRKNLENFIDELALGYIKKCRIVEVRYL